MVPFTSRVFFFFLKKSELFALWIHSQCVRTFTLLDFFELDTHSRLFRFFVFPNFHFQVQTDRKCILAQFLCFSMCWVEWLLFKQFLISASAAWMERGKSWATFCRGFSVRPWTLLTPPTQCSPVRPSNRLGLEMVGEGFFILPFWVSYSVDES